MKRFALMTLIAVSLVLVACKTGYASGGDDETPKSSAKAITAFNFSSALNADKGVTSDATGTISGTDIAVTVPYGTTRTGLIATFTTTGDSAKIDTTVQVSGTTANDFSTAKAYTVTAQDGSMQNYTVTVTVAASSAKEITEFGFTSALNSGSHITSDVTGNISGTSITVSIPNPTNSVSLANLIATYSTSGASVKIGSATQISGVTPNVFTGEQTYTVVAADGSTQNYSVTVNAADTTAPANVTGLTAIAGSGQVTLNWTGEPSDPDFSKYEITATPSIPTVYVNGLGTKNATIAGLTNPATYTFTVKSVDTANNKSTGSSTGATPGFIVTYDGNGNTGGTAPTDNRGYASGATVTVLGNTGKLVNTPPAGTAECYKFAGWNTQADGNGTAYAAGSGSFIATSDAILYAQWVPFSLRDTGPAGGLIFYDKGSFSSGWRYLEAAPKDQSTFKSGVSWSSMGNGYGTATGATGTAIGTGKSNTAKIISVLSSASSGGCVAKRCAAQTIGGYADWFLPSRDELVLMHTNLKLSGVGDFASGYDAYWSSTETNEIGAISMLFSDGVPRGSAKSYAYNHSRACRAF